MNERQYKMIGLGFLSGIAFFVLFFFLGIFPANASYVSTLDKNTAEASPAYGVSIPAYSGGVYRTLISQKVQAGYTGFFDYFLVPLNRNQNNSNRNFRWGLFDDVNGAPGTALYQSGFISTSTLPVYPTRATLTPTAYSVHLDYGDYFYLVVETEDSTSCGGGFCVNWTESSFASAGALQLCDSSFANCYDPGHGSPQQTARMATYIAVFELDPPTLFSPALPYVSSSKPIRFVIEYSDGGGRVTCNNTANSWRQTGALGGTGDYWTFSVDMEEGDNTIICIQTLDSYTSDPLSFVLTYNNGGSGIATPVFEEIVPNFVFGYNPGRVVVQGLEDGNIWCKKGSGSFANKGSILSGEKIYFDIDFTDIAPLADSPEYTISCYLETIGGDSDTVQQVYKYGSVSECLPTLSVNSGDSGVVVSTFSTIYSSIWELPVIGDMMFLNCIIFLDFFANLETVTTSDLSYHITAFNLDQDTTVPLVALKNSLTDWVTGNGYSGIKDAVTIAAWAFVLFGLFFTFVFPMIHHGKDNGPRENKRDFEDEDYFNPED